MVVRESQAIFNAFQAASHVRVTPGARGDAGQEGNRDQSSANASETFACWLYTRVHQVKRVLASKSVFSQPGFRVGAGSRWLKRLLRAGRCALRPAKRLLARVAEEPVNRAVRDGWRQGPGAGAVAKRTCGPRRHGGTLSRAVGLWDWAEPLVTGLFHQQRARTFRAVSSGLSEGGEVSRTRCRTGRDRKCRIRSARQRTSSSRILAATSTQSYCGQLWPGRASRRRALPGSRGGSS